MNGETNFGREGAAALMLAVLAPMLWGPLFVASLGLVLAAFVLAILAITKGKTTAGIILIVACPFALVCAFATLGR